MVFDIFQKTEEDLNFYERIFYTTHVRLFVSDYYFKNFLAVYGMH